MTKRRFETYGVTDRELSGFIAVGRLEVNDTFIHPDGMEYTITQIRKAQRFTELQVEELNYNLTLSTTLSVKKLRRTT